VLPTPGVRAREKEFRRHGFYFSPERGADSLLQERPGKLRQCARRQCQEQLVTSAECGRLNRSLDARKRKEVSIVRRENIRALSRRPVLPLRFAGETFLISAALPFDARRRSCGYGRRAGARLPVFPERLPLTIVSTPRRTRRRARLPRR